MILFIPDVRGGGHSVRCRALADELEMRGSETYTLGSHEPVPFRGYSAVVIDARGEIRNFSDIPRTIRIIDDPEAQRGACDLLVLGCSLADPLDSRANVHAGPVGKVLVGPRYSLLRYEFKAAQGIGPVVMGEAKREGILDVRHACGQSAEAMAADMSMAQVVITYGGMRAMEAACCGAPMVVVPRNRGEHLNARGLAEAGAAIISTEGEAQHMAEEMLRAAPLEIMGLAGRKLVDGRGCERVADEIERLFR